MPDWLATQPESLIAVILSALIIYPTLILITRLSGLRSFSQVSGFDFAMTVAIGSVIANGIVSEDPPVFQAVVAIAMIFLLRFVLSFLRARFRFASRLVDNRPILLIEDGRVLEHNLRKTRMSEHDLLSKLREHNVFDLKSVRAAVLESGGDVSVLRGDGELDDYIMKDVQR